MLQATTSVPQGQMSVNKDSNTSSLQTQALLIHHSRDTARKQWAKTEVLTLNGVARLFQTRWSTLVELEGFNKAWGTLLEFIKSCAQSLSTELALNALLERCKEVLAKFVHEERLSGQCPLPRSRMNEVSLVLKSVSVLISSLKEAQKSSAKVDKSIWKQVVLLYPALVQCVTCLSMEVRVALKEVLSQFSELIKP
eukprot:Em0001g653a